VAGELGAITEDVSPHRPAFLRRLMRRRALRTTTPSTAHFAAALLSAAVIGCWWAEPTLCHRGCGCGCGYGCGCSCLSPGPLLRVLGASLVLPKREDPILGGSAYEQYFNNGV